MNRIVLIGNGFDLAHGLKTSYKNLFWGVRIESQSGSPTQPPQKEEKRYHMHHGAKDGEEWFNESHISIFNWSHTKIFACSYIKIFGL